MRSESKSSARALADSVPAYKQPPLVQTYFGHAIGTAALGALLPSGDQLSSLHALVRPVVELIPNAVRVTNRAPDPIFAQTFIGISLLIAFAILVIYVIAMRGYHTKTFLSAGKRWAVLLVMWLLVLFMLTSLWRWPYLDPLSKGRAHFLLMAATSGRLGVVTAMNQLVVGMPMLFLLVLWLGHFCTTARSRAGFV